MDKHSSSNNRHRLTGHFHCQKNGRRYHCQATDIDEFGLSITGISCLQTNDIFTLDLGTHTNKNLYLTCKVVRVNPSSFDLKFENCSAKNLDALKQAINQEWDGKNILEGIIKFGPVQPHNTLSEWLRLTSVISSWQNIRR